MEDAGDIVGGRECIVTVYCFHRDLCVCGVQVEVPRDLSGRHLYVLLGDFLGVEGVAEIRGYDDRAVDQRHVHRRIVDASMGDLYDCGVVAYADGILGHVDGNDDPKDCHGSYRSPFRYDRALFGGALYKVDRAPVGVAQVLWAGAYNYVYQIVGCVEYDLVGEGYADVHDQI